VLAPDVAAAEEESPGDNREWGEQPQEAHSAGTRGVSGSPSGSGRHGSSSPGAPRPRNAGCARPSARAYDRNAADGFMEAERRGRGRPIDPGDTCRAWRLPDGEGPTVN
jgi:hypothetical protein